MPKLSESQNTSNSFSFSFPFESVQRSSCALSAQAFAVVAMSKKLMANPLFPSCAFSNANLVYFLAALVSTYNPLSACFLFL